MIQTISTKRSYPEIDPKTLKETGKLLTYTYQIKLEDKLVKEVINDKGYVLPTNSEVFEYYSKLYNN